MASILEKLRVYGGKWSPKSNDNFSNEDIENCESAVVVPSEYGQSVCLTLKSGSKRYLPVSNTSRAVENGEQINIAECKVVTLGREGNDDIMRIEVK